MSSSASTMPRLKKCFQYRFTSDRAKKGLSLLVSQSAKACRASSSGERSSGFEPSPAGLTDCLVFLFVAVGIARDRESTRLNSSHLVISYAVFCLKKKKKK